MVRAKSAKDRLTKLQALKLQQSVNSRDVGRIVKLISNGVPDLVNITDSYDGITGVHIAACSNDVDTLKLLFNFGADFNVVDKSSKTAYMKAAEYGHIEALSILIKLCDFPDLDTEDNDGRNILFYCLHGTKRHQLCMEVAIKNGANFHVIANSGKSLLIEACELELTDAVRALLGEGIDVNVKHQKTGETSLQVACKKGLTDIARMLLKRGANPDIGDRHGNHCTHKAAKGNYLDILQLLSAYGSKLGIINAQQETPMHVAAHKGYGPVCLFLGQRGCPANLKNKKGYTPRAVAKNNGHKAAIKACKKAEKCKVQKSGTQYHMVQFYDWLRENIDTIMADVEKHDVSESGEIKTEYMQSILKKHKSPLDDETHLEILRAHDKLSTGMISYDVLFSGKKFIHKSCLVKDTKKKEKSEKKGGKNKPTKVTVPICTNAKVTTVRPDDGGPFTNYIERKENITDRFRFDRDHQPPHQIHDDSFWYLNRKDPTYIHMNEAVRNSDKETIKIAIHNGYNVNQVDQYYKTPLMLACLDGNYELAKFLVDHGADINTVDNFKWSAIHFACHSGQTDLVTLLLNNGADIDAQTLNGGTPLMRAIESAKVDVVRLLADRGAKVYLQNKKGQNALQIAKQFSDLRIVGIVAQRLLDAPPPVENKRKQNDTQVKSTSHKKVSSNPTVLPEIKTKEETFPPKSQLSAPAALSNSFNGEKAVKFHVQQEWLPQLNTNELLIEKSKKRERFGYEIDFDDYKPPFQNNVDKLLNSAIEAM